MPMTATEVQKLYVAYFNRPADYLGLEYWKTQSPAAAATAFAASAEYAATYAGMDTGARVNAIYQNLFGHAADLPGLAYWSGQVSAGRLTIADVVVAVSNGAQGTDKAAFDAKVTAASAFTSALNTTDEVTGYSGAAANNAAKAWLSGINSAAQAAAAVAPTVLDASVSQVVALGGTIGKTISLTTDPDTVEITTSGTIDTVKGVWRDADTDTFTVGDEINGNGHTRVEIVVDDTGTLPYVEMSGVAQIHAVAATSGAFTIDGSSVGTDLSKISMAGVDGAAFSVTGLDLIGGSLELAIAAAQTGDMDASGELNGVDFDVSMYNSDDDAVGASISFGSSGINVVLGNSDTASLTYSQEKTDDGASVSVGSLSIAGISVDMGDSASAEISITNYAYNSGTGDNKGSATVGNVTIGDIVVTGGEGADFTLNIYNSASANEGAATVGNVTIGNVALNIGDSGSNSAFYVYNSAEATKGNATVGNITVGDFSAVGGENANPLYAYFYNYASAVSSGNAKVGNITFGDILIDVGTSGSYGTLYVSNYAFATKGTATVGNALFGDITLRAGDDSTTEAYFEYNATADNNGTDTARVASIGTTTFGNVVMDVGLSASADFSFDLFAETGKGAAKIGAVSLGDVSVNVDGSGYATVSISISASGTAGDSIGNVSFGDFDFLVGFGAFADLSVEIEAVNGDVANVTFGDISFDIEASASASVSVSITGDNVGVVSVGDININVLADGSLHSWEFSVSADDGNLAGFSVGDITVVGEGNADITTMSFSVSAYYDIGNVSFGDVAVALGASADFDGLEISVDASYGEIGSFAIGNISMFGDESASGSITIDLEADDEIGSITVGSISLAANGDYADMEFSMSVSASDDIGVVTVGNVSLVAEGTSAYADAYFWFDANANRIQSVDIGNVSLLASGSSASVYFSAYIGTSDDDLVMEGVTIGSISIDLANTDGATDSAEVYVYLNSYDDITVGSISLSQGEVTDEFNASASVYAYVSITSETGDVRVGDITVVGGYENSTGALLDNFDVLSNWLYLDAAGGDVYVGNIDYRGYENSATIDVDDYKGASVIYAAQDDTIIYHGTAKNTIYLGDGDDTVVFKNTTTLKASADVVDVIFNFETGSDTIEFDGSGTDFSFSAAQASSLTYAAFLTAAGDAMSSTGVDVYARKIGSDVFVAVDKDNGSSVDFVIKLAGISSVQAADFNIF